MLEYFQKNRSFGEEQERMLKFFFLFREMFLLNFLCIYSVPVNTEADWTNDLRNNAMYHNPVELNRWILLTTERTKNDALNFAKLLGDAARGLQFTIKPPKV